MKLSLKGFAEDPDTSASQPSCACSNISVVSRCHIFKDFSSIVGIYSYQGLDSNDKPEYAIENSDGDIVATISFYSTNNVSHYFSIQSDDI